MIELGWLAFLAEPWFVVPWYTVGVLGAIWIAYDAANNYQPLNNPLKVAWPIITVFFSVIGIALYLLTARPKGLSKMSHDEKKEAFEKQSKSTFNKVIASASHCVAGDGLGIISAMVLARVLQFSFWEEFWFEYAVGYAFGWFIFQTWSMYMHSGSVPKAIWMGGRAEFFSMITVMAGMGFVMGWVTPHVIGAQPPPDTFGFWGFAMLGLLVGFIATYPMNLFLVKVEWKHGMG